MEKQIYSAETDVFDEWLLSEPAISGAFSPPHQPGYLHSLHDYVLECEDSLNEIRASIECLAPDAAEPAVLRRIAARLGKICMDADGWGFNRIYRLSQAIQTLVFDVYTGNRGWTAQVAQGVQRGLAILSSILRECENNFRLTLEMAEFLEALPQLGKSQINQSPAISV